MKLLLLQLSDIHLSTSKDPVLGRTGLIAAAAQSIGSEVESCLVLVTGDIAAKGLAEEYEIATKFFGDLHRDLEASLNPLVSVSLLFLPGNHDCDFSSGQAIREHLVSSLLRDPSDIDESDIAELLLAPQKNYKAFVDGFRDQGLSPASEQESHFLSRYSLSVGDRNVLICALNSALLSQIRETPGELYFPPARIPEATSDPTSLAITAFHHPYQWFHPNNARDLRSAVERNSDLVLTGHEHVASHRRTLVATGENFTQIEAAVLQDTAQPQNSGFNAFVLDLLSKQQRSFEFFYKGSYYGTDDGNTSPDWTELSLNKIRARGSFPISSSQQEMIDDPGVALRAGDKTEIKLNDFYVFPDLMESSLGHASPRHIRGDKIVGALAAEEICLVTGDSCSGKSSLGKALFSAFHSKGEVPLLLIAHKSLRHTRALNKRLDSCIADQYHSTSKETYWQLSKEHRTLIIDDFERIAPSAEKRGNIIQALRGRFGRVILLADDLASDLLELADPLATRVTHFRIQPFGHLHRDELVEKWLCINPDTDGVLLARKVTETTRTLNQVVGAGFMPAYPVYVLAVLQACEESMPIDTSISTHGYYFEILIRSDLLRGSTSKDFDVLTGHLAYVAYRMFSNRKTDLTIAEFAKLHADYESSYDLPLSMDRILDRLCERRMLVRKNDLVEFRYPYIYNYFVASYLRDHLDDLEVRGAIAKLAENTHRRTANDILLFLAHLSKDKFIINTLIDRAGQHYAGTHPVTELASVAVPGNLRKTLDNVAYEERDVRDSRREIAAARDDIDANGKSFETVDIADEFDEALSPVRDLVAALRTMQVVGQFLKNFPGHLEADTKLKLAKAGYGIGVRAWRALHTKLLEHKEELARDIVQVLHDDDPTATSATLNDRAETAIRGLVCLSAVGFVRRTADALGAPELSATYDKLVKAENNDIVRLVRLAIELDHSQSIAEGAVLRMYEQIVGDPLGEWIVQQLTVRHFSFFPVKPATKQSLCAKIGIDYKSGFMSRERGKLLKSKK